MQTNIGAEKPEVVLWKLYESETAVCSVELAKDFTKNGEDSDKGFSFSWLKALITTFTFKFKTLLRHYARHYARQAHKHGK